MAPPVTFKNVPSSLFEGVDCAPQPVLVATCKKIDGLTQSEQQATFAAVVSGSLQAAVDHSLVNRSEGRSSPSASTSRRPIFRDCMEETAVFSTMHGFNVAKFTVRNPLILEILGTLTDTSPLLPIQQPNPGFQEIHLSWEHRVAQYYRTVTGIPSGMSLEALAEIINAEITCKYVTAQIGPSACPITGAHVFEFTVPSATDIPVEFNIPSPTRGQKPLSLRVLHITSIDHQRAMELAKQQAQEVAPPPPPPPRRWATIAAKPKPAPPAPPSRQPKGRKQGKDPMKPTPAADMLFDAAKARVMTYKAKLEDKEKALAVEQARQAREIAAREAAEAAVAAAAAEQAAADAAAEAAAEAAELDATAAFVTSFVGLALQTAIAQHAPEEASEMDTGESAAATVTAKAAAVAKATAAARGSAQTARAPQTAAAKKRVYLSSSDEEESDEETLPDATKNKKPDPKKAKDTGHASRVALRTRPRQKSD